MSVEKVPFGELSDGRKVDAFVITNSKGLSVKICQLGAAIVSVEALDKNGNVDDVVLGYSDASGYETDTSYIGMVIGRVSSRIGNARFELDGETFQLEANERGVTHLHGGPNGFHRKIWSAEIVSENAVKMSIVSPDGESGYPGTLSASVTYSWSDDSELMLKYSATVSDRATVIDLTNHSYFNLAGATSGSSQKQFLWTNADKHLTVDRDYIPPGEMRETRGTVFDFHEFRCLEDFTSTGTHGAQLVLNRKSDELILAARVFDPESGRTLECFSDQNSLVFYDGKFVGGIGKDGKEHVPFAGFCLESQNFTNAVNIPNFKTPRLDVGGEYRHTCIYKFGVNC